MYLYNRVMCKSDMVMCNVMCADFVLQKTDCSCQGN